MAMNRRSFLELGGGLALASLFYSPLSAGSPDRSWPAYDSSLVIDGLGGALDLSKRDMEPALFETFRRSGVTAINQTVPYPGDGFTQTTKKVSRMLSLIARHPDRLRLITAVEDIGLAKKQRQLGVIMGFQSTEMFSESLEEIGFFADLGVRYMQLTYNGPSAFGGGGLAPPQMGLTELGRGALAEMERLEVLVDLSHANKLTVQNAIAASTRPMTLSHTGCNAIYEHPRNNDDAEFRALADKGGVAGIYLMPFLEGGDHEIPAETVLRHLDHMVNVCGEDHVSIGTDQGIEPVEDTPEYREMIRREVERRIAAGISAPGETPERPPFIPQLNTERRMETLAFLMARRGYPDSRIEKILGRNLVRLYREVWPA